jgi:mono/diheme cytochrome c family protein
LAPRRGNPVPIDQIRVAELIGDPDYASNMPAYDGILTDADIIAALSYIKSTWPQEIRDRHDAIESQR